MKFTAVLIAVCVASSGCTSTDTSTSQAQRPIVKSYPKAYIKVPGSKTIMRKGPSNNTERVASVRHGDSVEILGKQNSWVKVRELTGYNQVGWVSSVFVARSVEELEPRSSSNNGAAIAVGAAAGVGLIACSLGGIVGTNCFGGGRSKVSRRSSLPRGSDKDQIVSEGRVQQSEGVGKPASISTTSSATVPTKLVNVRNNGSISGNPSFVINCTWGSKTVIRKDNKWTDDIGYSFSDRTWALELNTFASRLCERII